MTIRKQAETNLATKFNESVVRKMETLLTKEKKLNKELKKVQADMVALEKNPEDFMEPENDEDETETSNFKLNYISKYLL